MPPTAPLTLTVVAVPLPAATVLVDAPWCTITSASPCDACGAALVGADDPPEGATVCVAVAPGRIRKTHTRCCTDPTHDHTTTLP